MKINREIRQILEKPNNLYDLIAVCFDLLCKKVKDQPKFLNMYFGKMSGAECNPNIDRLQQFSAKVRDEVRGYIPEKYADIRKHILDMIEELELLPYQKGKGKTEQLTVIYALLKGIDAGAAAWKPNQIGYILGPLNKESQTKYQVYFHIQDTLQNQYEKDIGRKRVHGNTFDEKFQSFRFLDSAKWQKEGIRVPQMKMISSKGRRKRKKGKRTEEDYRLKIGVIPVSRQANFKIERSVGAGIRLRYPENKQNEFVKNVEKAMEKALKEDCDIIILPEFVVIPQMYTTISDLLQKNANNYGIEKNPFLVFAGSTWTGDDNNVMRIFDAWGMLVGEYYKYSRFTEDETGKFSFDIYEDLQNPGGKCDIFVVEGIGTFLPAICRDVINNEYTSILAKAFLPLFVMISAYSSSVASFEPRQKDFANEHFTSSVLTNACSAVKGGEGAEEGERKIANGCIIQRKGTLPDADIQPICRSQCAGNGCKDGCVFILEYDFFCEKAQHKDTRLCVRKV